MRWLKKILMVAPAILGLQTQGQAQSKAYGAMLGALLSHSVPEMRVETASREASKLFFLDTREAREYAVSHIKGARWVGYDTFSLESIKDLSRDSRIVAYCSVGYRSEKIAEKLRAAGFKDVHNLYGGIFEWVNQGNPVYQGDSPTDRIHAYDRVWGVWLKRGKKVYGNEKK